MDTLERAKNDTFHRATQCAISCVGLKNCGLTSTSAVTERVQMRIEFNYAYFTMIGSVCFCVILILSFGSFIVLRFCLRWHHQVGVS